MCCCLLMVYWIEVLCGMHTPLPILQPSDGNVLLSTCSIWDCSTILNVPTLLLCPPPPSPSYGQGVLMCHSPLVEYGIVLLYEMYQPLPPYMVRGWSCAVLYLWHRGLYYHMQFKTPCSPHSLVVVMWCSLHVGYGIIVP